MDTDIIAGIHEDLDTVLVLSGVTDEQEITRYAYRPKYILPSVGAIPN